GLDAVVEARASANVSVPAPRTWRLPLDAPLPDDLTFPLFVRTVESSWKLSGSISRVKNAAELEAESAALRRALGWDALILAREGLGLAPGGEGRCGAVPQGVRGSRVGGAALGSCV